MKKINSKGIFGAVAIVPFLVFFVVFFTSCGNNNLSTQTRAENAGLISPEVTISGINVGSMSKKQATDIINKKTKSMGIPIFEFRCQNRKFSVSAEEIELKAEVYEAVTKAYNAGKSNNNTGDKKKTFKSKKNIPLIYSFNEEKLLLIANDYLADIISDPSPMNVEIGEDCLVVTNALLGKTVNTESIKESIAKELSDFVSDNPIEITMKDVKIKNMTFAEFKSKYLRSPKDATYSKKDGKPVIEPEVVGIDFDEDEALRILKENKNATKSYKIPAKIIYPQVSAKALEIKYINVPLSSFSTSFAGSSPGRIENIRLAASKINGYVLNPGERFSYNQVVGPRTEAAGFKVAHVYVGNQVVDGVGGGICQVSSALYNAVVLADLKTVSRTNHSIPVSYVPKGRDATVAYGTIDYVFENNKSYPVSIKAWISQSTLTVSMVGLEKMNYTVEFESHQTSVIPFSVVREDDAGLLEGEEKIVVYGIDGSVYDSYRVYKKNGVEYDRKHESKSRYVPTSQKIAVGTKKATRAVSGGRIKYGNENTVDESLKKRQNNTDTKEKPEPEKRESQDLGIQTPTDS